MIDERGGCSVQCGGKCCQSFPINASPARIGELYQLAKREVTEFGSTKVSDLDMVTLGEMLVRLDREGDEAVRYTCKHLDTDTGLCGSYDTRPAMCRDYPEYGTGGGCSMCGYRPIGAGNDCQMHST